MTQRGRVLGASAAAMLLALSSGKASAQGETEEPRTIDELIVTAQKREQNLQDVPIVVTSVSGQQLRDAGVRDIKDLAIAAPGLIVTSSSSPATTNARIRGIGTVGDNPGLESSVGVVIDGVPRPRNGAAFSDLGELERIEMLKGPQGTLFGKNTTAGVINVITKRPEFSLHADSEVTLGNFDAFGANASITGPLLADKVAARLYAAVRERGGYYKRSPLPDSNDQDLHTIRGQVLFTPSADVDLNISADYTRRHDRCCGAVQFVNGPTAAVINAFVLPGGLAIPPDPGALRDYSNRDFLKRIVDDGVQGELNWDTGALGGAKLTSITAYRRFSQSGGSDVDWTSADLLFVPADDPGYVKFKTFTQEVRLAGESGPLNWLVGGFYSHERLDRRVRDITTGSQFETYANVLLAAAGGLPGLTGLPPGAAYGLGTGQNDFYHQRETGFSLFTNESYKITDQLELTVGARYTWEKKRLSSMWNNVGGAGCATALARLGAVGRTIPASAYALLCPVYFNPRFAQIGANSQSLKEDKASGTAKLAYRFTPQVMAYVSYARGYKAGGFNLDRVTARGAVQTVPGQAIAPVLDTSFAPEMVDSYEAGAKTTLLDRSLLLNATVFYQEYKNFQHNAFNGVAFTVTSIPKVVSKGVDTDLLWYTPVRGLTLNGGVTYAETYYPKSTPVALGGNFPGGRIALAPLWSVVGGVSYEAPVSEHLVARFALNAKHTSSYNTGSDLNPLKTQKQITLLNGRVALAEADKRWSLEAWAQNLTNEKYVQVGFDAPFQTGTIDAFMGAPRTYGMTLRFSY